MSEPLLSPPPFKPDGHRDLAYTLLWATWHAQTEASVVAEPRGIAICWDTKKSEWRLYSVSNYRIDPTETPIFPRSIPDHEPTLIAYADGRIVPASTVDWRS